LVGAAVTVAGAFVTGRYAAWQERKSKRKALLASYLGEVTVIRTELSAYLEFVKPSIEEEEELPEINELLQPAMPKKVFEETVGSLGELGDWKLAEQITSLYARIERAEDRTRSFIANPRPVAEEGRRGHFLEHIALLGDATITIYLIKELLVHDSREQVTDLMHGDLFGTRRTRRTTSSW
jgi:hypothetical protein